MSHDLTALKNAIGASSPVASETATSEPQEWPSTIGRSTPSFRNAFRIRCACAIGVHSLPRGRSL